MRLRPAASASFVFAVGPTIYLASFYLHNTSTWLRAIGSASSLVALLLIQRDPIGLQPRQRAFVTSAFVAAILSWFFSSPGADLSLRSQILFIVANTLAIVLVRVLPLWNVASFERRLFQATLVAAAGFGLYAAYLAGHSLSSTTLIFGHGDYQAYQIAWPGFQWAAYGGTALTCLILGLHLMRPAPAETPPNSPNAAPAAMATEAPQVPPQPPAQP